MADDMAKQAAQERYEEARVELLAAAQAVGALGPRLLRHLRATRSELAVELTNPLARFDRRRAASRERRPGGSDMSNYDRPVLIGL